MKAWKAVDQISIVALNPAIGLGPTNHKTISIEDGRFIHQKSRNEPKAGFLWYPKMAVTPRLDLWGPGPAPGMEHYPYP